MTNNNKNSNTEAKNTMNEELENIQDEELKNVKAELEKFKKLNEEYAQKNKELEKELEDVKTKDVKETKVVASSEKKDKTYIVEAPVKNFVGEVAGVHFAYGKAEVKEGWVLEWFKEKGYKITEKE